MLLVQKQVQGGAHRALQGPAHCALQGIAVRELKAQIPSCPDAEQKAELERKLQEDVKKLKALKATVAASQKRCAQHPTDSRLDHPRPVGCTARSD